jgi:hypothetical protein
MNRSGAHRPLLLALLGALAACALLAPGASALTLSLGSQQTLVSADTRLGTGLDAWPDGPFGVQKSSTGYVYTAPNHGDVQRTTGTLTNPIADGSGTQIRVQGARGTVPDLGYAAGGPVYTDPKSSTRLMFLHLERYPTGSAADGFYGAIGLARSTDRGKTWRYLGEIFSQNWSYEQFKSDPGRCTTDAGRTEYGVVNTGFGQFVVRNEGGTDYFYLYAPDTQAPAPGSTDLCQVNFAVARAPVAAVLAAAAAGNPGTWSKRYAGGWTESSLGGRSDDIRPRQGRFSFDVAYDSYLGSYLLVMPVPIGGGQFSLQLQQSSDGLNWSAPQTLFTMSGEIYAPSIIGTGKDPNVAGKSFYVWFGQSPDGWLTSSRRIDGRLLSRLVTLG